MARQRKQDAVVRSPSPNSAATRPRTDENIFLFVPNLIGYSRVILAAFSLTYMSYHPKYCTTLYVISCLLDAVDGQAARALGQTSKFGAILDMVTDRCTTSCLLCFLASSYPKFALLFQALITLDFSSHYIHMYASLVMGSKSHKSVTKETSWILWSYYNNTKTLFLVCAGNELFFVSLYLMAFYDRTIGLANYAHLLPPAVRASLPPDTIKTIHTLTWPHILGLCTFPICALKQVINCVQFWKAAKSLAESDQEERYELQQAKKRQ